MPPIQPRSPFADGTSLWRQRSRELGPFAHNHGHVLLRGLAPVQSVRQVAGAVLAAAHGMGWLAANDAPVVAPTAASDAARSDSPGWIRLQQRVQANPVFSALGECAALLDAVATVVGAPPLTRCGDIVRVVLPGAIPTPAHQDYHYIAHSTDLWTAWLPLTPCPAALGPIAVVDRSHRGGPLRHDAEQHGAHPGVTLRGDEPWCSGELQPGDVLLFHSLTVHGALTNRSKNTARLSVDYRFRAP